jgi:acetoin utilization protein AcuB
MNHLLSKVTVEKIMSKDVLTVTENTPIEEAARTMVDNKIGGLPVIRDGKIVGIITETDLFKIFLELMGAREFGVRVTAFIQEEPGQLAKLTRSITEAGGNFIAFGQFAGEDPTNRLVTFKVEGVTEEELRTLIEPLVEEIIDLRVTPT